MAPEKKTALWPCLERGFDHTKTSVSSFHGSWDGQKNDYCLCVDCCRTKGTGYAYFMPVWHLLRVLYHLPSTGWTPHYFIMYRVKTGYCWAPTPSVSQLLSGFGTRSGLSSNIAQQNCYLCVLQQLSFIYSDLSPHLSSSLLLHGFWGLGFCLVGFFSETSSPQLFFWGLTAKLGLFLLFWSAGASLVFPHKAPDQEC